MTHGSPLFAAEELEAERRLLGKIGIGRLTVDEFVANILESRKPVVKIARPKVIIDYKKSAELYGYRYRLTKVEVTPGTMDH